MSTIHAKLGSADKNVWPLRGAIQIKLTLLSEGRGANPCPLNKMQVFVEGEIILVLPQQGQILQKHGS